MKSWGMAVCGLLLLSACDRSGEVRQQMSEASACTARIVQADEFQLVKDKLPPINAPIPMSLLTDDRRPTPEEAKLLVVVHDKLFVPCRDLSLRAYQTAGPIYAAILSNGYAESDQAYARLVRREISWGEYAATRQRVDEKTKVEIAEAVRRDQAQRAAIAAATRPVTCLPSFGGGVTCF